MPLSPPEENVPPAFGKRQPIRPELVELEIESFPPACVIQRVEDVLLLDGVRLLRTLCLQKAAMLGEQPFVKVGGLGLGLLIEGFLALELSRQRKPTFQAYAI